MRGITREEVSADLILTHKTSKRGDVLSFDLNLCEAVMEEWFSAPPSGPLIIDPETDLPYEGWKFRRLWRWLATEEECLEHGQPRRPDCGELDAAGVPLDDIGKLAGHERSETTRRNYRDVQPAIKRALRNARGEPEES